jgi:hypothetical protein
MTGKPSCLLLALCLLLFAVPALAQEPAPGLTARNTFFAELYGNGGRYSLNYDRIFLQRNRFKASFRVGASLQSFRNNIAGDRYLQGALPLELNGLWGRGPHHLELGLGFTPVLQERPVANTRPYLPSYFGRIGYRYQQPGGGLFFRAGLTPGLHRISSSQQDYHFGWAHGGIGLGWSF